MAEIFAWEPDAWELSLRKIGFFLGKFIYLMDAYEDVEKDIGNNSYNPLKETFLQKTPEQFATECRTLLTMMMAECSREFEQRRYFKKHLVFRGVVQVYYGYVQTI